MRPMRRSREMHLTLQPHEQVREGSRERAEKKITEKSRASSNVFARLLAAGQRLLTVINKCEGMPNKELGKFADQINALCNKWDR